MSKCYSIFFTFALCAILFNNCNTKSKDETEKSSVDLETFTEGTLHYEAKVLNDNHPLAMYAPSEAEVKIKGDKWYIEMAAMGIFRMFFTFDGGKNTLTQMAKCMDLKAACVEDSSQIVAENAKYVLEFKETTDTKVIAGYKCNRVIANKVENPTDTFSVYYTKQIGFENSNNLTPYKNIKGMLMDYRMLRLGIEMRFEVKSVKKVEIPENVFDVPKDYEILPRSDFDTKLNAYLSGVM